MSKALILFLLTLFWLPASCTILPDKKHVEVKMSGPKSRQVEPSIKKGECGLRIKNLSSSEIIVCQNSHQLGRVEAKSQKIFFNCLDCQGGQISIAAGKILLIGNNLLTLKNSDLPWLEKPLKGNLWTILVCPDLTIPELPKDMCQ
jgi:hypothetical protein